MHLDPTIYTISDLHLGHKNIIRYCNRPFSSVGDMDRTLVDRWNRAIHPADTVIFLGDLTLSRSKHPREYLRSLNGIKILVRGNHDALIENTHDDYILEYGETTLYFVHDRKDTQIPEGFDGWIVHGHTHDSTPFFDPGTRMVNVSAEVLGYRPLSLLWLYSLIVSEKETLYTISDFSKDELVRGIPVRPSTSSQIV